MHRADLPIHAPCHVDWSAMRGDAQHRLCSQCDKHVHDLSAMSEQTARAIAQPGRCVRYTTRSDGTLYHPPRVRPSRRAAIRGLFASLVALPLGILSDRASAAVKDAICGRVVDRFGEPVVRAIVSLEPGGMELVTDRYGLFRIDYLRDDKGERAKVRHNTEYLLEISAPGCHTYRITVPYTRGQLEIETIFMFALDLDLENFSPLVDPARYAPAVEDHPTMGFM